MNSRGHNDLIGGFVISAVLKTVLNLLMMGILFLCIGIISRYLFIAFKAGWNLSGGSL